MFVFIELMTMPGRTYPPGPGTVTSSRLESGQPSPVQMAPSSSQSTVTGKTTVTSASESGKIVTSQRTLPGGASRPRIGSSAYGPATVMLALLDSFLPYLVHTALSAVQSVVGLSAIVTAPFPLGCTVISHLLLGVLLCG